MARLVSSAQLFLGRCWRCRKEGRGLFHCSHQLFCCYSPCKCSHTSVIVAHCSSAGDLALQQVNLQKESSWWSSLVFPTRLQPEASAAQSRGLAEAGMLGQRPQKLARTSSPLPGDLEQCSSAARPGMIPGQLPRLKNSNMQL